VGTGKRRRLKKPLDNPHGCGMMCLSTRETTAMDDFDLRVQCEEFYVDDEDYHQYIWNSEAEEEA
jgi:hypothetical protein